MKLGNNYARKQFPEKTQKNRGKEKRDSGGWEGNDFLFFFFVRCLFQ